MPRMQRLDSPGSLVHIMARGIDGKSVFLDNKDRTEFLRRFAMHREQTGYKCLAWCLMPNHYHLMMRMTENPPSALMRPLNGGYAKWFNGKYQRRGYVFQDRYKSVLCQDSDYANELIRYIHLNPVRAGLAKSLAGLRSWKWCGHAFLLGIRGATGEDFQERAEALRRFGSMPQRAVEAYVAFLEKGMDVADPADAGHLSHTEAFEVSGAAKGWPAVIGDPEFARAAMQRHSVARQRTHRQADYPAVLEKLASGICAEFDLTRQELLRRGRGNSRSAARAQFCHRAHFDRKLPYAAIAGFLGTTIPPVMIMARRVEDQARGNR